ncbi:hypothetical protein IWQ60_009347 [Tieghemiomyces parasiticus]|uniref:HTH APSES-type domain-containing protein n=1 Tax=Tieghemiomyces parasiticus TaxID=78921 RepID=A0A9W7ZNC2_9FUNG|nr:hypothetical protein IWQ60_009347 [Tieghemiomyces parasiticus]
MNGAYQGGGHWPVVAPTNANFLNNSSVAAAAVGHFPAHWQMFAGGAAGMHPAGEHYGHPAYPRGKLSTTLWEDENTMCFQVDVQTFSVARRQDDNYVNGTKLLNVTGMSRGKRDGILKGVPHRRVIKVGAMHLKGVWIPFPRAKALAMQYNIIDVLYPLFVDNPAVYLNSVSDSSANVTSAVTATTGTAAVSSPTGHHVAGSTLTTPIALSPASAASTSTPGSTAGSPVLAPDMYLTPNAMSYRQSHGLTSVASTGPTRSAVVSPYSRHAAPSRYMPYGYVNMSPSHGRVPTAYTAVTGSPPSLPPPSSAHHHHHLHHYAPQTTLSLPSTGPSTPTITANPTTETGADGSPSHTHFPRSMVGDVKAFGSGVEGGYGGLTHSSYSPYAMGDHTHAYQTAVVNHHSQLSQLASAAEGITHSTDILTGVEACQNTFEHASLPPPSSNEYNTLSHSDDGNSVGYSQAKADDDVEN